MRHQKSGLWSQLNSITTQLSKKLQSLPKSYLTEQAMSFTSSATLAQCTMPMMMRNGGVFSRQQYEHFWTNFNYDLYNRICEIKYSEL